MFVAPKISKEIGFVNFKTWTAGYCDRIYRAIGKEVSDVVCYNQCNGIYFVVWNLGTIWNQKS